MYLYKKLLNCFPNRLYHFAFSPTLYESYSHSISSLALGIVRACFLFLFVCFLSFCPGIVTLIWIFLLSKDVEIFFCVYLPSVSLFGEVSIQIVWPFFKKLVCYVWVMKVFLLSIIVYALVLMLIILLWGGYY